MATKKSSRNARYLLTAREVIAAGDGDVSDGAGLYLRIRGPSASWVFRYTAATGKRREMGLGAVTRSDPAAAGRSLTTGRELAEAARQLLARGIDPIDDRDRADQAARDAALALKAESKAQALTLARASRGYHEKFIEPHRSDKHSAQWIASLENHVPDELWNRPIAQVTPGQLLDFLTDLNHRVPETAGRIRQRLDAIFDDALLREHVDRNPAAAIRRKLREVGGKKKPTHFRSLPYPRVPAFMQALQQQAGVAAIAMRFLVLTASRTSEALLASWPELDLAEAVWTIPGERMKGGEDHVVHLSSDALALVKAQHRDPNRDPLWVFPSPIGNDKALSNMAFLELLKRMGEIKATTAHGFRSSFSTWANETGYRSDVIEACLAHRESDRVRAAYNKAKFTEERKQLLADWAAFCRKEDIALKTAASRLRQSAARRVDARCAA